MQNALLIVDLTTFGVVESYHDCIGTRISGLPIVGLSEDESGAGKRRKGKSEVVRVKDGDFQSTCTVKTLRAWGSLDSL